VTSTAPAAAPSRGTLALLTGTHVVNDFYTGAVPPLLPFFVAQRGYDYAAVGGMALAATACSSLVQPVFGVWADRHRTGWIATAGMMMAATGVAVCGVTGSYGWTCGALALSGIGWRPTTLKLPGPPGRPPAAPPRTFRSRSSC
jgi:FSR family fosmidomycin resistance protein-like MFS transporter